MEKYKCSLFVTIVFILSFSIQSKAQLFSIENQKALDSLNSIIDNPNSHDTSLAEAYVHLSDILYVSNIDTVIYLCENSVKIAQDGLNDYSDTLVQKSLLKSLADALNNIGFAYGEKGNISKKLEFYTKSLEIQEEIGNELGMANSYNNMAVLFKDQGNISRALEYHYKSMKLNEKNGNKRGVAISLNNIARIYEDQKDINKALEYYFQSLKIREEIKDKNLISIVLNNIGEIYRVQNDTSKAFEYFNRSLKLREEIGWKEGIGTSYGNIGKVYWDQKNYPKALVAFEKSYDIFKEIEHKQGMATSTSNIGNIEFINGKINDAEKHGQYSLELSREIGYPENIQRAAFLLSNVYEKEQKGMPALEMYKLYILMRDSINNEETQKANAQLQARFIYEKQKSIDDIENDKLIAIEKKEKEKQQIFTYATATILLLVVVFLYFVFNRLKITRKQKTQIEKQKNEVENQRDVIKIAHKEITDSISYAKRIQNAILPPARIVKEYLEDSFILYNPKDVVAGDFYWMRHVDKKILFAAADCTGHGVPGAMVSVVCNNALNRSVREYGITDPGEILNKTRDIVVREFEKSDQEVNDGMDIALCVLEGSTLTYAGAYNPLWIIRNGELLETKANRFPIGLSRNPQPYTTHTIKLEKDDVLYIFTDGFVDQFGGQYGKKYKANNFKNLLLDIYSKPMAEQRNLINESFEHWRGHLEQVDDICIIGVRF